MVWLDRRWGYWQLNAPALGLNSWTHISDN